MLMIFALVLSMKSVLVLSMKSALVLSMKFAHVFVDYIACFVLPDLIVVSRDFIVNIGTG